MENPPVDATRTFRAPAVAGMLGSAVWVVALMLEYRYGLRPPGNGSGFYKADQAAFALAQLCYLVMLVGLFRIRPGGPGAFGVFAIGIWVIATAALVIGQVLGLFGVSAVFLLPIGGIGQILGSLLTSVAVWRAGLWKGWRRLAPAIWTAYVIVLIGAVLASIPVISIPTAAPNPSAPSPWAEALWQGAWFLLSLALYVEAGLAPRQSGDRAPNSAR